jgi:hypothetical protein
MGSFLKRLRRKNPDLEVSDVDGEDDDFQVGPKP